METKQGIVKAKPPGEAGQSGDSSLPDPTSRGLRFLALCLGLALIAAFATDALGWATRPFKPASTGTADFALFAGFYVAAQLIERLMEVVAPFFPYWAMPADLPKDQAVRAAQIKADRAKAVLGLAILAGVAASAGFGLYFLAAVGMWDVPRTADIFFTAVVIAAGTKPLHDFISSLQNQNSPTTGTGV
jgi:hypothetical protein